MQRRRYWALMAPQELPIHEMTPWPIKQSPMKMGDLFDSWGTWASHEEDDLMLSQREYACYFDVSYGHDARILQKDATCATAPHSYSVSFFSMSMWLPVRSIS